MDKILEVALNAEQKARQIVAEAEKIKKQCERNIKDSQKISQARMNEAEETVRLYREAADAKCNAGCDEIDSRLEEMLADMDDNARRSGDAWADTLFDDITKRL